MTATAHPEIQVYASLPRAVALGADLDLDAENWDWVHCLTLPLKTLSELDFSPRPYKWIRYAIGIVVGAEGHLSSSSNSLDILDYNSALPEESTTLYYHATDEERRRMFPLDPNNERTSITSASIATTRRGQFRSDVAERDGNQCVLSGLDESLCDAVHLLAHSKGDKYISTYTQRRSRDPSGGDLVQESNSVRNGLFLNKFTHATSRKHVAFLPTPNFAMNTADVDPTASPGEKRCTAHLFMPSKPSYLGSIDVPSGTPIRISDTPDWPPSILFDAVYAGAVLHHFGAQILKDQVAATWMDTFYPGGVMTAAERAQIKAQEREAREASYAARTSPDIFDMLLDLPYILVPANERKAMLRKAEEKAEQEEQSRAREKVDSWLRQVNSS